MPNPNPATIPDDDYECADCGCVPCQCDGLDEAEDRWEEAMMDCGLGSDGLCSKAGSEECDFDCPFSH
jgi:hypothetical protein